MMTESVTYASNGTENHAVNVMGIAGAPDDQAETLLWAMRFLTDRYREAGAKVRMVNTGIVNGRLYFDVEVGRE